MRASIILIHLIVILLILPYVSHASTIDLDNLGIDASRSEIIIVSHDQNVLNDAIDMGYAGAFDSVQAAIDHAFSGTTIFIDSGTYEPFVIGGIQSGLTITGLNPLIESAAGWGFVAQIYDSIDITLDSLKIAHSDTASYFGTMLYISCSSEITVTNCEFYGPGEAGIQLLSSEDITITGNRLHDITYTGIKINMWQVDSTGYPYLVSDLDIRGNYFYDIPLAIEGYTADTDSLDYFRNNYMYDPDEGPVDAEPFDLHDIDPTLLLALTTIVSHDPEVIAAAEELGVNKVYANLREAVEYAEPAESIVVCPGVYQSFDIPSYVFGIEILGYDAEVVSSNSLEPVIEILNTSQIWLEGLNVYHAVDGVCQGGCIHICGSRQVTITGCDIHGSGVFGIWIDMSADIDITNNLIHDCTYAGLQLENADWFCSSDIWRINRILVEGNYFYRNAINLEDRWGDEWQVVSFRKNNYFEEPEWIN